MIKSGPPHELPRTGERLWAVVRLVLGVGQIMGATAGFSLLLQTGLSSPTLWVVAATTGLMLTSKILFRRRRA